MSAPWEIEAWMNNDGEARWDASVMRTEWDGGAFGDTRYLRADLTCGECKKCRKSECDHKVGASTGAIQTWPYEDSPACMAFVPKEAK